MKDGRGCANRRPRLQPQPQPHRPTRHWTLDTGVDLVACVAIEPRNRVSYVNAFGQVLEVNTSDADGDGDGWQCAMWRRKSVALALALALPLARHARHEAYERKSSTPKLVV